MEGDSASNATRSLIYLDKTTLKESLERYICQHSLVLIRVLTATKVPGRNASVTHVITCIEIVSFSVLYAIFSIFSDWICELSVNMWLTCVLRYCRIPSNCGEWLAVSN